MKFWGFFLFKIFRLNLPLVGINVLGLKPCHSLVIHKMIFSLSCGIMQSPQLLILNFIGSIL